MKNILLLFLLTICYGTIYSQLNKDVWLVDGTRHLGNNFKKYKMEFTFDARNTFVGKTKAKLGGIKLGLKINRIHQIGIGLYGMNQSIQIKQLPNTTFDFYRGNVSFSYVSLFYERDLYFDKKWEWTAAIHFGSGEIIASYELQEDGDEILLPTIQTKPLELSSSIYHHFTYWLSVGGGLGYRVMRKTPELYRPYFNGAIYLVKLKIRLFKLVQSIYNKDVKNEY